MSPNLENHARAIVNARARLKLIMTQAQGAAQAASAVGMTEVAIARELGVTRMTVRKWLGK